MSGAGKIVRAVLGLAVVGVLVFVLRGYWTEYKAAAPSKTAETTASVDASGAPGTKPAEPSPADQLAQNATVLVIIEGLNFRKQPDATGESIRGLKKGERLILVSTNNTWLQVQDTSGNVGWITNNPQYVKIEKKK